MSEFIEYSKVSVHNHFGDSNSERTLNDSFNKQIIFSYKDAVRQLKDAKSAGFDLLAFTNANVFLLSEYLSLKIIADKIGLSLIPGIEINVINKDKDKYLHVVVLFSPQMNLINIKKKIDDIILLNQGNYVTIPQLVEIIIGEKVIVIPHGLKQVGTGRSSANNPEQLKEIIAMDNAIPVMIEDNQTFHRETLMAQLNSELNDKEMAWLEKAASVSCADRQSFSEITAPTYIWGDSNYGDLYFAALMKGSRIKRKNDIITKTSYISSIRITSKNANAQIHEKILNCSHGLNSIIGKSGSGKTLLLNAIKRELTGNNLNSKTSGISEYNEIYKDVNIELLDSKGHRITIDSNWEVFEGENLYNKILQVYSSDKTKLVKELDLEVEDRLFKMRIMEFSQNISDYVNSQIKIKKLFDKVDKYISGFNSNVKFLEKNDILKENNVSYLIDLQISSKLQKTMNNIAEYNNDLKKIDYNINELKEMAEKYHIKNIDSKLKLVEEKFHKTMLLEILKLKHLEITYKKTVRVQNELYKIVREYNLKLGEKMEAIIIKKQENLNFIELISNNLQELFKLKLSSILKPIYTNDFKNSLSLKRNDISRLFIKNIKLKFDKDDLTTIFDSSIGPSSSKVNLSKFKLESIDLTKTDSIIEFLQVFVNEEYSFPINLNLNYNNYINYEIQLKNSTEKFENIETMSAGELSKTYISNMLDRQIKRGGSNLIVLFDQPDSSLEKYFILMELVDKIDKLRNRFQVFVTTHEPLLVVNADSNKIIKAENNKAAISSKNSIKYSELSFIEDSQTKEKMVEKISELVDGSHNAVKKRNEIYGGMLNED